MAVPTRAARDAGPYHAHLKRTASSLTAPTLLLRCCASSVDKYSHKIGMLPIDGSGLSQLHASYTVPARLYIVSFYASANRHCRSHTGRGARVQNRAVIRLQHLLPDGVLTYLPRVGGCGKGNRGYIAHLVVIYITGTWGGW